MACTTRDILESGSSRYSSLVYLFVDQLRIEMKISLDVNYRSLSLKYTSRAHSFNITRGAKMMVEHVDLIAKKARPTDGLPTGLPAHGYRASSRYLIFFPPLAAVNLLLRHEKLCRPTLEPSWIDRTKTTTYAQRVIRGDGSRRLR